VDEGIVQCLLLPTPFATRFELFCQISIILDIDHISAGKRLLLF
jgi:hypothetical protein